MTETGWFAATDPTPLIAYVRGRVTGRQLAMAAIALCRSNRKLMRPGYSRDRVVWSERVTDGELTTDDSGEMDPVAGYLMGAAASRCAAAAGLAAAGELGSAHDYLADVVDLMTDEAGVRRQKRMAEECRDIFGNPYRPVAFDPAWRTEAVVALARGMYESRAFGALPVLADALEDAGCTDPDVLGHCRGVGPHVRGCWVVDLVLGKVEAQAEPVTARRTGRVAPPAPPPGPRPPA